MTIVLIGKALFWGGWPSRTEVIGALGIYIYTLGDIMRWVVAFVGNLEIWGSYLDLPRHQRRILCTNSWPDFFSDVFQKVWFFFLEKKVLSRPSNWKKQTNTSETKGVWCVSLLFLMKKNRWGSLTSPAGILSECYQFVSCNAGAWCWPGCWLRFRAAQQWKFPCSRSEGCNFQKMCFFPIHKMWLLDIWPGFQWDCCFCGPSLGETHSSRVVSEGL